MYVVGFQLHFLAKKAPGGRSWYEEIGRSGLNRLEHVHRIDLPRAVKINQNNNIV